MIRRLFWAFGIALIAAVLFALFYTNPGLMLLFLGAWLASEGCWRLASGRWSWQGPPPAGEGFGRADLLRTLERALPEDAGVYRFQIDYYTPPAPEAFWFLHAGTMCAEELDRLKPNVDWRVGFDHRTQQLRVIIGVPQAFEESTPAAEAPEDDA